MTCDIRLFLTDLDGTLLRHDHLTVTPRTRSALTALRDAGVPLCACTGRVLCLLPPAVRELDFDYALTSNGASCVDLHTGETVFSAYIPAEQAERAWALLSRVNCMIEWFVGGDILMDRASYEQWPERVRAWWHREYFGAGKGVVVEDIRDFFAAGAPKLEKISVMDLSPEVGPLAIEPMLAQGDFEVSSSLGNNFEITSIRADKGLGLRRLCDHLGISPEQTIAFGDGGNDVKLLRAAGTGVAMGNALPIVRENADAVTLTNDEDGVAAYLEANLLH